MAKKEIYFFTDPGLLDAPESASTYKQIEDDSFGSVNTTGTKFLCCSVHKSNNPSVNPPAYAVMHGKVAAYEHDDGIHATLVLKPDIQPSGLNDLPAIKYYIYRGILLSSIINGASIAASNAGNDMINLIWLKYQETGPPPKESILVYKNSTNPLQTPISDSFENKAAGLAPYHDVDPGDCIGKFSASGFSMEIIFDDYDYEPELSILVPTTEEPLDYIRHYITAETLVNVSNERFSSFLQRHKREEVLHYLDPAAFYGSLYFTNVHYRIGSSNVKDDTDGFYNEVTTKFLNKNVLWLDIRNNHGKSFNYYNFLEATTNAYESDYGYYPRYEEKVYIGIDQYSTTVPFQSDSYYSNGWPLRKITSPILSANLTNKNVYKIALSHDRLEDSRYDYQQMMYVANGFINDGTKFSKHVPKERERFIDLKKDRVFDYPSSSFYFGLFEIPVPNLPSSSAAKPVCWYTRLYYLRQTQAKFSDAVKKSLIPHPQYFLDYAFDPIAMNRKAENSNYKNFRTTTYIDFEPEGHSQGDFTGSIGIAKDSLYTSLFIVPEKSRSSILKRASKGISDAGGSIPASQNFLDYLDKKILKKSISPGKLEFETELPASKIYYRILNEYGYANYSDLGLTVLTMKNTNWNTILEFIQDKFSSGELSEDLGVSFVIKDRNDTNTDADDDLDKNKEYYLSFHLYVKGFTQLTPGNLVKPVEFDLGLTFYGKKDNSLKKLSTIFIEDNITNSLILDKPEELPCPELKFKSDDLARVHDYTYNTGITYSDTEIDTATQTITELSATIFKEDLVDFITQVVDEVYEPIPSSTDYKITFGNKHNLFLTYHHVWSKMIVTGSEQNIVLNLQDNDRSSPKKIYGDATSPSYVLKPYKFRPATKLSGKVQLKFDNLTHEISGGDHVQSQGFFLEAAYTFAMWKLGRTMRHVFYYIKGLRQSDLDTKLPYYFEQLATSSPFYKRLEQAIEHNYIQAPHKLFEDGRYPSNDIIKDILNAYSTIFEDNKDYDNGLKTIFFPLTNSNPGYVTRIKPFNDFTISDEDSVRRKLIRDISNVKKDYLQKVIYCIYERLGGTGKYSSFYNFAIKPTDNSTAHIFNDQSGIFFMDVMFGTKVEDIDDKLFPFDLQRSETRGTVAIVHMGLYGVDQSTYIKPQITGYISKSGLSVSAFYQLGDEFYRVSRGYTDGDDDPAIDIYPDNVWRQTIAGGTPIVLGSFNPETGDLIITNDDVAILNLRFFTEGEDGQKEIHFSTVCVSEIPATGMFSFAKAFPDLFTDDVFQLSEAQLSQIWNFSSDESDNIDTLIKILFNNDAVLKADMTGGFIGKRILPTLYVTGNSYEAGDMVTFISNTDELHVYKATTTTSGTPGNTSWVKQEYSVSTTYQKEDFVSDGVFIYQCLENNTTANTNDQTKWKTVAQKYHDGTNFCYQDKVVYKDPNGVQKYLKCIGDDISGVFNNNSWLVTSEIESDKKYTFNPDNNLAPFGLTEIQTPPAVGSLTADQFTRVRYAYADIQWSLNDNVINIHIEAYASPLISRLDHVMSNNGKSVSLVKDHTLYGQDAAVDAFIDRIGEPDIPSYNQLLTALRCWGILKGIAEQIQSRTNSTFPEMSTKIQAKLTEMLNGASVKTTFSNGYPNISNKEINHANYLQIKL